MVQLNGLLQKRRDCCFKRTLPVTTGNTGWGRPLDIWENLAETSKYGVEANY